MHIKKKNRAANKKKLQNKQSKCAEQTHLKLRSSWTQLIVSSSSDRIEHYTHQIYVNFSFWLTEICCDMGGVKLKRLWVRTPGIMLVGDNVDGLVLIGL